MSALSSHCSDDTDEPLVAVVMGEAVVITGFRNVAVAMTPEAVLDSLGVLRIAAEKAIWNRANPIPGAGKDEPV